MKPVMRQSAEAQAIEILRDQIVGGGLKAGARLIEIDLAASLAISRATLRQALHHLAQEGLVILIPYTGWMVAHLSAEDAWELYTLRAAMDGMAARLTTERLTSLGSKTLKAVMVRLVKASNTSDAQACVDADWALHRTIVDLAGHRRLSEHYRIVAQQVRMLIASSNALLSSSTQMIDQHRPIVDAVLGGNPSDAAACAEQHDIAEGARLVEHLRSKNAEAKR